MSFDARQHPWRRVELRDGETLVGTVARLPRDGAFNGGSVFLELDDGEIVAIHATAKKGHTVLERLLGDVRVGDRVAITYHGRRTTADGERSYRSYSLNILEPKVADLRDYRATAVEDPNPPWWAAA